MILAVESLSVERGGRLVLSDLSFTVAAGETLMVTGRNGAGKSTLLRALAGLLAIQGGRIHVAPADAERRPAEAIHYLGYEDALKPSLTLRENLTFWAAMLATGTAAGGQKALPPEQALGALGIARLVDLPAAYLSAGQKRRAALARLLVDPRPIWLLDEPSIALDVGAQATLAALMTRHVEAGGAIIAASHGPLGVPARTLELGAQA